MQPGQFQRDLERPLSTEELKRAKAKAELQHASKHLNWMERATKQQMLKNHFGAWMQPNELKVLRQYRSGSSANMPRHPCQFGRMSRALSQAREYNAGMQEPGGRHLTRSSGPKKSVKFGNSRGGFDDKESQFSLSSLKSRKSMRTMHRASGKRDGFDAKRIVKRMKIYFQNHPTCLEKPPEDLPARLDASVARYMLKHPDAEAREVNAYRRDIQTLKPNYEDTASYNLDACIEEAGRKPFFGYPFTEIVDDQGEEQESRTLSVDHLKPVAYTRKREKNIMDHVLKCFTFGKPVRRIEAPEDEKGNKIEEMQRKFNRVRLIRTFHSVKRRNL